MTIDKPRLSTRHIATLSFGFFGIQFDWNLHKACLLRVLDASINISRELFRAFVADMLPRSQHASGYAMRSMFIGLGAIMFLCAVLWDPSPARRNIRRARTV